MKWVICASGPSMLRVDLAHLKRFRTWNVMAVNCTWRLVPWARVLYAGDREFWRAYGWQAQAFQGQKWTRDEFAASWFGLKRVRGLDGVGLCREPGAVNCGGNSGYQAINLAWHLGARRIVLLGYDMHRLNGGHWHGEHADMLSAPEKHIAEWPGRFKPLARDLAAAGCEVVNATPGSALTCFPTMTMGDALRC